MAQTIVKPKIQKILRNPNAKSKLAGYKDYIAIALSSDITVRPVRPDLTSTVEGAAYATATVTAPAFGTATFGKLEVEVGTLKVSQKPIGNIQETTGVMTEITFELADTPDNNGYISSLLGAPLDIVIEKNNGDCIWYGDADRSAYITGFTPENERTKGRITVVITFDVLRGLYLPSGTAINYVA